MEDSVNFIDISKILEVLEIEDFISSIDNLLEGEIYGT